MSPKNTQVFINSTAYVKKGNHSNNHSKKMTLLKDINLTPVSELGIHTHVGPSERSATHV